ncbi:hypothetical protein MTO96_025987 [Rhipicephalus appendiculatus]
MFSHPFYAEVLGLSLLKASFKGFAVPGIPLLLVSPSSWTGENVQLKFHRSQPISCQQPRLTATSDLIWQPKPTSVLALSLLKASFNGFVVPGIPLPLKSPSSLTGENVLVKFHRSQPIFVPAAKTGGDI